MNNIIPGCCDRCGRSENPLELYVVPGRVEYLFFCKACFDTIDVTEYFAAIMDGGFIPDVYSEQEFNHHKLDIVPIGFSRGAMLDRSKIIPFNFEEEIIKEVESEFFSQKVRDKFIFKSHRSRMIKHSPDYYEVRIAAKCQHSSYKQFLEHELYKHMRSDVNFTVQ